VRNLLEYAALKLMCSAIGVTSIEKKRDQVFMKFAKEARVDPEALANFVAGQRGAQFTPDGTLKFQLTANVADQVLGRMKNVLLELAPETVKLR
jgi:transcription-repair coupling factor (superfamily II helicase)